MVSYFFECDSIMEQEAIGIAQAHGDWKEGVSIIVEDGKELILSAEEMINYLEYLGYTVTMEG